MPLSYRALIGALGAWLLGLLRNRTPPQAVTPGAADKWRLVLVFSGASFVVGARMRTICRYVMPLELLSGALLIYPLGLSVPKPLAPHCRSG